MILPRIKSIKENSGRFNKEWILPENSEGNKAIRLLNLFAPDLKTSLGTNSNIKFNRVDFENNGEYKISATEDLIVIDYCNYEGLRNAIATISGLKDQGKIKCAEIHDYPDNDFRSCLLDLARGYVEPDILKEHLIRLAKLKFSYVHLHLMDRQSYILKSDVVPNPDNHRQYTKEEMKEIVALCNELSLEAIPEIEFPAHAVNLLKAVPELACDIINIDKAKEKALKAENPRKVYYMDAKQEKSSWAVCIGKESTYEIFEGIIDEIVDIFDGKYIHIGGDEIEFSHLAAHPHWDNCHECKKLMEMYNSDLLSIYHHGIRRINEIVKSKGKKAIKWNESKECSHSVDLPKDIILEYWLGNNPNTSQSPIDRFIDMGYKVINAHYKFTYVDEHEYMNAEKISCWSPVNSSKQKEAVLGGEMCAWELGNEDYSYYGYTLPICMVLFSDRVWNSDVAEYNDEYTRSIFSAVIGQNVSGINPLCIFEEVIPPRYKDVLSGLKWDSINPSQILEIISKLNDIDAETCYGKFALTDFKKYLTDLHTAIIREKGILK